MTRRRAGASLLVSAGAALLVSVFAALVLLGAGCGSGAGGAPASPAPGPPTDPGLSPEPVPGEVSPGSSRTPTAASSGATSGGSSAIRTVYLLGGSGAREGIVSNAAWSAELSALTGTDVRAIVLGATNQSYTADRRYVHNMKNGPTLVVVGVGVGRYTSPPPNLRIDDKLSPELQRALDGEVEPEHRYDERRIRSFEKKRELVATWLAERYPFFRKNYAANRDELEALLRECRARGFRTMLLELPLNVAVVGDDLDAVRETYIKDCRRLAARYRSSWVSFVDEQALPDTSFYDLLHLMEPGRAPWQTRLSKEIAALLAER